MILEGEKRWKRARKYDSNGIRKDSVTQCTM